MAALPFWLSDEQRERIPATMQEEMNLIIRELHQAEDIFNNVTDDELTEASIYRIQSLTAYRDYLIRTARENKRQEASSKEAISI